MKTIERSASRKGSLTASAPNGCRYAIHAARDSHGRAYHWYAHRYIGEARPVIVTARTLRELDNALAALR